MLFPTELWKSTKQKTGQPRRKVGAFSMVAAGGALSRMGNGRRGEKSVGLQIPACPAVSPVGMRVQPAWAQAPRAGRGLAATCAGGSRWVSYSGAILTLSVDDGALCGPDERLGRAAPPYSMGMMLCQTCTELSGAACFRVNLLIFKLVTSVLGSD